MKEREIVIQKFGGTSLATPERLRRVAEYVKETVAGGTKVVAIVSAMSNTTDDLIQLAGEVSKGFCLPREEMDSLLVTGEIESAALLAIALNSMEVRAASLNGIQIGLEVDAALQRIRRISGVDRIREAVSRNGAVVIAGFQGVTEGTQDRFITIGRGGSDLTAIAVAAALEENYCEICTDVDGVYGIDPRIVKEARRFERIAFSQMLPLAENGAGVLMPRCVSLAQNLGVEIRVLLSPSIGKTTGGTLVCSGSTLEDMEPFVYQAGVAVQRGKLVRITNISNKPGMASKIFSALSSINIIDGDQSLGDEKAEISIFCYSDDLEKVLGSLSELKTSNNLFSGINILDGLDVVGFTLVSLLMRQEPGYLYRMFRGLAEVGVNIEMFSSSGATILAVVKEEHLEEAALALAKEFRLL